MTASRPDSAANGASARLDRTTDHPLGHQPVRRASPASRTTLPLPKLMTSRAEMETAIHHALDQVERERDVRILFAYESGSRGWGFESQDSDYDVRFIYAHRLEWYLSIESHRDVVEMPISGLLDVNGWELRKSLRLLRKSNPALLEWLSSPIVYREHAPIMRDYRALLPGYYSALACMQHYLSMAKGNFRAYLEGELVRTKKYLYVLRPVLACRWIEAGLGVVPMQFAVLYQAVAPADGSVRAAIDELMAQKKAGFESDRGPRIDVLNGFLAGEIARFEALHIKPPKRRPVEEMDRFFRGAVERAWTA
jgi:predicted nucleotidyltransferase